MGVLNAARVDVLLVLAALSQVLEVHRCTGCAGDHIHSVLVLAAGRHLARWCGWVEQRGEEGLERQRVEKTDS